MTMLKYISAAALGAIVALAAVIALVLPAAPAAASPASSHTSLWWDGTTCHAFASGRFHMMVVASRHADTYLRVDVALWAHDLKVHASKTVTALDRMNVAIDCTETGDGSPL